MNRLTIEGITLDEFLDKQTEITRQVVKEELKKIKGPPAEVMRLNDVAEMLRVNVCTIHRKKKEGKIPFHRDRSGKPYFLRSEIIESMQKVEL